MDFQSLRPSTKARSWLLQRLGCSISPCCLPRLTCFGSPQMFPIFPTRFRSTSPLWPLAPRLLSVFLLPIRCSSILLPSGLSIACPPSRAHMPAHPNKTRQVPEPVKVEIPVCYSLGINERKFVHGAHVRLRFFENAQGTPKGWLLGCVFIHKQVLLRFKVQGSGFRV